jgi:sterol 24-C-methyltransferase
MDIAEFLSLYDQPEARAHRHAEMVNQWYDWATSVYRRSWGDRFHFARFTGDEDFAEACRLQEDFMFADLALAPGMRVLDMGSGLGGPARYLAQQKPVRVVGVDLSAQRVELARRRAEEDGAAESCEFFVGDVAALPFDDASFDAVYSIEVGCYVPDKRAFYRTAARLVKPGRPFAGWDWAFKRPPTDAEQAEIVEPLLRLNAKPPLLQTVEIRAHLEEAGLEVQRFEDLSESSKRPWWEEVERRMSGRFTELLAASRPEVDILVKGTRPLLAAGKAGLLTPICYFSAIRRASP